jgi:hypothetical protein
MRDFSLTARLGAATADVLLPRAKRADEIRQRTKSVFSRNAIRIIPTPFPAYSHIQGRPVAHFLCSTFLLLEL